MKTLRLASLLLTAPLLATACECTPATPLDAAMGDAGDLGDAPPGDDAFVVRCTEPPELARGGEGIDPLPPVAGQARAGRAVEGDLPAFRSGLQTWQPGDFILANEHVAMVIEDVGRSDLYDPWGGRPVGMARIEGGRITAPGDFGEFFLLEGRFTVLTESVSVMNDGSDGQPAVVRALGWLRPLPFFENITDTLLTADFSSVRAAIDYVLAPDSNHIDIYFENASGSERELRSNLSLHGFMYGPRMPGFTPGEGFNATAVPSAFAAWVDDFGTSWAYEPPAGRLGGGIEASGFTGRIGAAITLPPCVVSRRQHARITIGAGDGLDALLVTRAQRTGDALRVISGVVREADGSPAAGARVHALSPEGTPLTRSLFTGPDGRYEVHVPATDAVDLRAWRRGALPTTAQRVATSDGSEDITLGGEGTLIIRATDLDGAALPVRIQVSPTGTTVLPDVPGSWGEDTDPRGRTNVTYAHTGNAEIPLAVGTYRVVVSRGYEYELVEAMAAITSGADVTINAVMEHSVETTNTQCGDFHIHTRRSNDAPDDGELKVRAAVAEGLEIPVRSDHEYVEDFEPEIARLGVGAFAFGIGSVEMSSMEIWGHMGVFPLTPDATEVNGGTPLWQEFPQPATPMTPLRTMSPPEVFNMVRARPESPAIIINHPMGSTNYFGYCGYDPVTGMVEREADWDEDFTLVEVFNDFHWRGTEVGVVPSWLSLLNHGRRVFAVGSSDSHGIQSSPVGYPRTCIDVGTDDPRMLTPSLVRDRLLAGRATVSGGIYLDVSVGGVRPGGEARGLGMRTPVRVRVQAASWIDVDAFDVVVDGVIRETIEILPADRDPMHPEVRFDRDVQVDVAAMNGYVVIAAYGDRALEPVHPGRIPFGVSNPIFLQR
jgi:hypothetical protein